MERINLQKMGTMIKWETKGCYEITEISDLQVLFSTKSNRCTTPCILSVCGVIYISVQMDQQYTLFILKLAPS